MNKSGVALTDAEMIPCKWGCGVKTRMLGTKMCDGCWEMERGIRRNPEVAERMLRELHPDRNSVAPK